MHEGHPGAAARLTSLYETHAADAFRYALHLTGRREDAEDVVQFVFLRAYGMLESGTELVSPRAWLIKATKHRSLNLIRDRRETPTAEAELPTGPRYDPDPAEAEALAEVRSTLWALPESQHHAFVLRHWSGLSQDEIADVLGTTPGAVESLLVRARTALLDDREQSTECAGVRRRLVQALAPMGGQDAHIRSCRRCRTAQARLLRASEFATAFALVPRPYVAHALATVVPGFGAPAAAAAATGATGAGAGAGAGTGAATASSAAKLALATKIALATATAVVAVSAVHPVRSAVERVVLGTTHASAKAAPTGTGRPAHTAGGNPAAAPAQAATTAAGRSSHGHSSAPHPGHGQGGPGKAKGKGKATPPAAGGPGKTKGKSGTAGSNGNGNAYGAGRAGGNGKSATAGSNGKAVGKPASTGSKGKANGNSGGAGTAATGGSSGSSHGNGKGNGKS